MVPARFFGAVGCNGEFTKEAEHAPLQLSEGERKDYSKWVNQGFRAGNYVVIIGGQSRSSIILPVSENEAFLTGYHLVREGGGRQAALAYLSENGYYVGEAGSAVATPSGRRPTPGDYDRIPRMRNPTTEAQRFQQQAEQEGIDTLEHDQIWRVGCRLLWYGWDPTWEWFREQFDEDFKPGVAWDNLESAARLFYPDMNIPDRPV
jgi:hypothetical protein